MLKGDFVSTIISYFSASGKKYTDKITAEITRVAGEIPEDRLGDIWEHLRDNNKASFMVSVSEIVEACRVLRIPYTKQAAYVPAENWLCEVCGHEFKYSIIAEDIDQIQKSIFRRCPRCGFPPEETALYERGGGASASSEARTCYHSLYWRQAQERKADGGWFKAAEQMRQEKKMQGDKLFPDKRYQYKED